MVNTVPAAMGTAKRVRSAFLLTIAGDLVLIGLRVSLHTHRHTFALHPVKEDQKLGAVRKALGHSSLATTSIFVDLARAVRDEALRKRARSLHRGAILSSLT